MGPIIAALGWAAIAGLQLSGHDFRGHYDAAIDYVRETVLMGAFIATAVSSITISRAQGGAGKWPARFVALASATTVATILVGLVASEEPDWFFTSVGPALVTMFVALIALGIRSWNEAVVPRWALVLIALTPLSVPAFWFYFSVVPAVGWYGVARGFARDRPK